MDDHDDFNDSAEKLIPPFSYQVSTVRLFKSDHGKVLCVYATCRACKVEAGQRCPFAMRYTLRKIEDATIEFSQPFLTSSHTLIIEETTGEHCSSHFSEEYYRRQKKQLRKDAARSGMASSAARLDFRPRDPTGCDANTTTNLQNAIFVA